MRHLGRIVVGFLVSCVLTSGSWLQSATERKGATSTVFGTWGTEQRLSNPIQGELCVRENPRGWTADVAGFHLSAISQGEIVRFRIPGNRGEFRGKLIPSARMIRGHWIQPAGDLLSTYTSTVVLRSMGDHAWRGIVKPLEERYSIYAVIRQADNGATKAFFSQPESNYPHGAFDVTTRGTNIHFSAKRLEFDGTYDPQSDVLSVRIPGIAAPLEMKRRDRSDAVGLYSRVPEPGGPYSYHQPLSDQDGWKISSLAAEQMDTLTIAKLVQRIMDADPFNNSLPIQSLLIARHGRLVLEEYFYGFDETRPHDMRSASKTFAPLLVGIARQHGVGLGPTTPVYSLFSTYGAPRNPDPRKQQITLGHLMTMSAGNACDDNADDSPGNEDTMQASGESDWYRFTLDLPMTSDPGGKKAIYCSGDLNLVGGAVAEATGTWLPDYFDQYVARPLQFGEYHLNLMPNGQAYLGGGAYVRPRDELKLGQLFLNGGLWNGHRIVSQSWVRESISSHTSFDPKYSLGYRHEYGYGWHISFLKAGDEEYRAYSAGGNGGQFVIVIPELELVIGINGGSYGEFNQWYRWEFELVPQYILAAVPRGHQ